MTASSRGCDDRTAPVCNEGFQWDELKGCIDVNECQPTSGLGPCQHHCVNTYGGFYCECPSGYWLEPKTNLCKDINECEKLHQPCGFDEFCLNVPGNYTCVKKQCPKNYIFDHKSRSCRVRCKDTTLPCPHGAQYADTVEYLIVSLPPPTQGRVTGSRVKLRVVDWNQVQQANCMYRLLEKAPDTPVSYHSEGGMVYLTPIRNQTHPTTDRNQGLLTAQIQYPDQAIAPQAGSRYYLAGELFYLFFRVSCYKHPLPAEVLARIDWGEPNSAQMDKQLRQNVLVFQHSFYVYISIAKHPF